MLDVVEMQPQRLGQVGFRRPQLDQQLKQLHERRAVAAPFDGQAQRTEPVLAQPFHLLEEQGPIELPRYCALPYRLEYGPEPRKQLTVLRPIFA
ncbi:hypothetical protein GCM10010994_36790 [Chelatococcus reniformis]|uniref:Uncharacterized protein n=1 Tax=Chelatococcus reniformis TaxID=1494448 RepID=A0A916UK42_9HYPH|nr:hypothetical protein GCM10010994_36790 [Chelatococcus reniformis]